jgi:hypothetical protein
MSKNIAAFTSCNSPQPGYVVPFVSVNRQAEGSVTISVRSGGQGNPPIGVITLTPEEWGTFKRQLIETDG